MTKDESKFVSLTKKKKKKKKKGGLSLQDDPTAFLVLKLNNQMM